MNCPSLTYRNALKYVIFDSFYRICTGRTRLTKTMFYDQYVLTKKKGGMGVVWLAATLGSKHSLRKLHKKDIMSVNIDEACEFVAYSPEPLALRLSSNLMIGVARVYAHQYSFFQSQVSSLHSRLRKELDNINGKLSKSIDARVEKSNTDNLILADDPAFVPELTLSNGLSLPSLDLNFTLNNDSISFDHTNLTSLQTLPEASNTFGNATQSFSLQNHAPMSRFDYEASNNLFPDEVLDFEFDENGEVHDISTQDKMPQLTPANSQDEEDHPDAQSPIEAHDEEQESRIRIYELDDDVLPLPVPLESVVDPNLEIQPQEEPVKRRRIQKIEPDESIELSTKTLSHWRSTYVERMKALETAKHMRRKGTSLEKKKQLKKLYHWESFHPIIQEWVGKLQPEPVHNQTEADDVELPMPNLENSDIEMGRDAQGSLELNMPWNTSSRSNSLLNSSKSQSQNGSEHSTPLLDTRYGKRLTPSPSMNNRLQFLPALESSQYHDHLNSELSLQLEDDFSLYKNTQEENIGNFLHMERECANFYEYTKTAIFENGGEMTFSELLPCTLQRSVAAQAFSHLLGTIYHTYFLLTYLALTTKSAVSVKQEAPYDEIVLSLNAL
ncbi:meiotic cohesin complex subunit Rec8 [Schizosaccharomyces cryophilus OY26]|uniref:Meiotic cohesin complex subunit Rec8 n=1 Tax=Schizosaccharomyces cryophilus (strain OY26 / ATCC MYA-4695 / CBS 11777 / NBRC 106824 / NRRL Y48691) TaxID=653667 RepID=S9VZK0_SCHCR|nr:meiotic cohesin complex subunit Rec8 [Schizosaccharomyces cryophilus OY26]EPY51629.1 meiotic cohesin complex subunit Rec8 [Schizosaccharomyces cryophilus OY26]